MNDDVARNQPADEWAEELPPDAAEKLRESREAAAAISNLPPELTAQLGELVSAFAGIGGISTDAIKAARQWLERWQSTFRPVRVKLISAARVERLEELTNEFLSSGVDIAHVSDRILRNGNEMIVEVHYYVEPQPLPITSTQPLIDQESGKQIGTRMNLANGQHADYYGDVGKLTAERVRELSEAADDIAPQRSDTGKDADEISSEE